MNKKEFSIVINNINENEYSIVINRFNINELGERVNLETEILNNLSFEDVKQKISNI